MLPAFSTCRARHRWAWVLRILTVGLVIASILPLFGSWHWIPDLFSHFAAHYAVTAVVLAIAWLSMRRYIAAILVIILLMVHLTSLSHYWVPPARFENVVGNAEVIRILQFNTHQKVPNQKEIMRWLEGELYRLDVVALLEIDPSWEAQLNALKHEFPNGGWRYSIDRNGIAVLSRLPVRRFSGEVLGTDILPTVILDLETLEQATPFAIYVTHPRAPVSSRKWTSRNNQLDAVANVIRNRGNPHAILLADLNSTVWSPVFRRFAAAAGLRDAQAGNGLRATWIRVGWPVWLGLPIDHTLISASFQVIAREFGPRFGSDHRPVITTLALPAIDERNDLVRR